MLELKLRRALLLVAALSPCCGGRSGLDSRALHDDETSSGGSALGGRPTAGSTGATTSSGNTSSFGGGAIGGLAGAPIAGAGASAGATAHGGAGLAGDSASGAGSGGAGGEGGEPEPPRAISADTGAFHSCALFDDGRARCWGTGFYLGYGNARDIGDDEPPRVAGDVDVGVAATALSVGWWRSCILTAAGSVRCWGDGHSGALGHGNTLHIGDDEAPATFGDVPVGGAVSQIAVGPLHTCAVLVAGGVRCWGSNQYGALGYGGDADESIGDDETPADVGDIDLGGERAVQVAVGTTFSCALLIGGKVRCWSDWTNLMNGDIELGGRAVQISASARYAYALLDNGKVRSWGVATNGVLGHVGAEVIGDDETPAEAGDVDVGGDVAQISSGDFATCALLVNGKVRCWGSGENGVLGYGNTQPIGDDEPPAAAGDVELGEPAVRVEVGFLNACATLASGRVRCWGRGVTAALGYQSREDVGDDETPASAGDVETH